MGEIEKLPPYLRAWQRDELYPALLKEHFAIFYPPSIQVVRKISDFPLHVEKKQFNYPHAPQYLDLFSRCAAENIRLIQETPHIVLAGSQYAPMWAESWIRRVGFMVGKSGFVGVAGGNLTADNWFANGVRDGRGTLAYAVIRGINRFPHPDMLEYALDKGIIYSEVDEDSFNPQVAEPMAARLKMSIGPSERALILTGDRQVSITAATAQLWEKLYPNAPIAILIPEGNKFEYGLNWQLRSDAKSQYHFIHVKEIGDTKEFLNPNTFARFDKEIQQFLRAVSPQ